jgi:hypothetical protein
MTQPFRMPVTKSYPLAHRLELCDALGELTDDLILRAPPRAEVAGSGERMILAIWGRAQSTYGAVMGLAADGDGSSSAMLSRPLFESMLDAYWIAKDPLKAQALATKNLRLLRLVVSEHYNARRLPGDPEMPSFPEDLADREALVKLFGPKAKTHWTRLDLRARARDVAADVPQTFDGELDDRYEEDNQLANLLLHGSPMAINDRITETPGRVTVSVGPTDQHLANGLRHSYWSYFRLARLLAARACPDRVSELDAIYGHGWPRLQTITDGALRETGRNGRCPCESGLKSKDCHGGL